ncbi:hypothetical protein [Kozakia baliensis]|nr:hypothetical protein [Kozakia baliensis]
MANDETPVSREIIQISPCDGWVFRHKNAHRADSIYPVAAWALLSTGAVVGLISVADAKDHHGRAKLVFPPPLGGTYERVSHPASETPYD